ncbi:hypothetical protein GBO86_07430 [Pediococcus acidilactici]|nr:hypothetical protein GBO86_07430 [Pediococcus acidilactici]UWF33157.1 hypothetical protein NYR25_06065 [Pediococcus acidilactici]
MKLPVFRKSGTLLYEGIVGLFILGSFFAVMMSAWHNWQTSINENRTELNRERETLNELRQKL